MDWKYLERNYYIIANVYSIVRPMMIVSLLNVYRLSFSIIFWSKQSVTTIYIVFTLC